MAQRKVPRPIPDPALDGAPAAVVIGADLNGLGVIRSLGAASCPIYVVDETRWHAGCWSNLSRTILVDALSGPAFVADLMRLGMRIGGRPFLIPTSEPALAAISPARGELASVFRFDLPSEAMVEVLQNKARFHEFALAHGLPVPRSVVLGSKADLAGLRGLELPIILKPAEKEPVHAGAIDRIYRLESYAEAEAIAGRLLDLTPELVAQDWIEGPDEGIYFSLFFRASQGDDGPLFFGRKLACSPPAIGSTAFCVPAPEARDALETVTRRFLACSNYRGVGSLEFKWDEQRREFFIIEPTVGRTDWQEELATLNGVNIPLAAYRDAVGLAPLRPEPSAPAAWREHLGRRLPAGRLPPGVRVYDGYWRASDPLPAVFYYPIRAAKAVQVFRAKSRTAVARLFLSRAVAG